MEQGNLDQYFHLVMSRDSLVPQLSIYRAEGLGTRLVQRLWYEA